MPDRSALALQLTDAIRLARAAVEHAGDRAFRAYGLSHRAHAVLSAVDLGGPDGARPKDVAAQLDVSRAAATTFIQRLETKGLVETTPDPEDDRGVRVTLTRRGLEVLLRASQLERRLAARAIEGLPASSIARAVHLLEELATEAAFRRNPARVFGWYLWRRRLVRAAVPHAGYHALVALERIVPELVVVTQNVDGLHRRVGSTRVIELHGSLERFSCLTARHPFPPDQVATPETDGECEPPRCPRCGALVRPDVVWFGEALPPDASTAARDSSARCDAMLVVGTSGLVQPAAQLPLVAREAGAVVIEVNPEPTEISRAAQITCRGAAGAVLPALLAAFTEREGERP